MHGQPDRSWLTIKPGTRCECRDAECPAEDHDGLYHDEVVGREQCPRDAVRMVTVPLGTAGTEAETVRDVPMCEPCADWHEKGGRKGSASPRDATEGGSDEQDGLPVLR